MGNISPAKSWKHYFLQLQIATSVEMENTSIDWVVSQNPHTSLIQPQDTYFKNICGGRGQTPRRRVYFAYTICYACMSPFVILKTPANLLYENVANVSPAQICLPGRHSSRGEASPDVVGEQTIVRGSGLKGSVPGPPITPPFLSVRGAWNFTNNRTV